MRIWLDRTVVDRLAHMRGPRREVILRLANVSP
jgi:hypothetical protein